MNSHVGWNMSRRGLLVLGHGVTEELLGKQPGLLSGNRGQIRNPRGKTAKGKDCDQS